jgi:nifR3 family TIM-barrel protein
VRIGGLLLDVPFFQAALSGYTSYPARRLAKDFGAPLVWAGLILASSAVDRRVLRKRLYAPGDDEHPIGAQILWHEPELAAKAAKALVGLGYDLIDLNFACPAPKVLRRQRGGAMMMYPSKVLEIYKAVRDAVTVPVTIKIRAGLDQTDLARTCFWEIVERVAAEGIDALVIHCRTVLQRYSGKADWAVICQVKGLYPGLTVIGSGDLFDVQTALNNLRSSGADGLAIARGAMGNPWLIRDLRAAFEGRPIPPPPSLQEQGQVILWHLDQVMQIYKPASRAIAYFRKFIVGYTKRHAQRKQALLDLLGAGTMEQLISRIGHWYGLAADRVSRSGGPLPL